MQSSRYRTLLPLPFLITGLLLLIVGLGYGSLWLGGRERPTAEEFAELESRGRNLRQERIGHHRVEEWPHDGQTFSEAPELAGRVRAGELPPVADRLPRDPLVIAPPQQIGPYGGVWSQFGTGPGDVGAMHTITYETLIRWDPLLQDFLPNLAVSWEVEDEGRLYTFKLREGVRWSDGEPLTADDILFWYEHVLLNSDLTPAIPQPYIRGGETMELVKLDDFTIQFRFLEPHGLFLQWVANPLMMELVSYPAHYFRQFHPAFADPEELRREARRRGFSFWYQVFLDKAEWHNVEEPTIAAWKLTRPPPVRQITYERNPYYWKVDPEGNQLPYIDRLTYEISAKETMNLRFLRGDMGMQFRHVDVRNYSLLMEHREEGNYRINEWISSFGSGVLMPNLNHRDPVMRELFSDRSFRIALSHAIDRKEISEALFSGMGRPLQMSPTFTSPLYRPEHAEAFTEFDPEKANRLLNELGLGRRDGEGMRLRPDGRPLRVSIETFDLIADTEAMQLVAEHWRAAGIRTDVKQLARSLFYTRMPARLHDVAVGGNSSMHTPLIDHMFFVPYGQGARHALAYSQWLLSDGERGEEPPPPLKRVAEVYREIERTADPEKQRELAQEILEINTHHLWLIGLVGDLPGIVLVHNTFRNVPDRAVIFGNAGVTAPECYAIEPN